MLVRFNSAPCWVCVCASTRHKEKQKECLKKLETRTESKQSQDIHIPFSKPEWTIMWISFKLLHNWGYCWRKEITYRGWKHWKMMKDALLKHDFDSHETCLGPGSIGIYQDMSLRDLILYCTCFTWLKTELWLMFSTWNLTRHIWIEFFSGNCIWYLQ